MEVDLGKDYFVLSENVRGHFKVERINIDGTVRGWPIDACNHNYAQDLKDISINDVRMPWADWVARVNTVKSELFSQRLSDADYRKWNRKLLSVIEMEGRHETCPCCCNENAKHGKNCLLKLLRERNMPVCEPTEENYIFWSIFHHETLDAEEAFEVSEIVGVEMLLQALRTDLGVNKSPLLEDIIDRLYAYSDGKTQHSGLAKLRLSDSCSDDDIRTVTILLGHTPVGKYSCSPSGEFIEFSIGDWKLY